MCFDWLKNKEQFFVNPSDKHILLGPYSIEFIAQASYTYIHFLTRGGFTETELLTTKGTKQNHNPINPYQNTRVF